MPHAPDALLWLALGLDIESLVGEIRNSAGRISELVGAMKDYSHMDKGPFERIDVHDGLESTLVILAHKLKKGVTVVRDYDRELPEICARGGELNQVWTNIIHNAIDAMDGKGTLTIRTRRDRDCVVVEIGDTGPGIPPELQRRIFEPVLHHQGRRSRHRASASTSATGSWSGATTATSVSSPSPATPASRCGSRSISPPLPPIPPDAGGGRQPKPHPWVPIPKLVPTSRGWASAPHERLRHPDPPAWPRLSCRSSAPRMRVD